MKTYHFINQTNMNLQNNIFSFDYDYTDPVENIYKWVYKGLIDCCNKSKFAYINEICNNFYFKQQDDKKNKIMYYFYQIQRTYFILNRFIFLYKYKKSKIIVENDLEMNKLQIHQPNVLCIYHNNYKYLFKIQELLKIIYTSLTNSYLFFAEPINIKNPYNNIVLGKSILYYIYFYLNTMVQIKTIQDKHLDIFLKFKECEFNITHFVNKYEHILREYSIQNYIINSDIDTLVCDIFKMVHVFNSGKNDIYSQICIDTKFPKKELVNIMKPYLNLYLHSRYSLVSTIKQKLIIRLNNKLNDFQKYNPNFGKKKIVLKTIQCGNKYKRVYSHIEYNKRYKSFHSYNTDNYMSDHLEYRYEMNDYVSNDNEELNIDMSTEYSPDSSSTGYGNGEEEEEEYADEYADNEAEDGEEEGEHDIDINTIFRNIFYNSDDSDAD